MTHSTFNARRIFRTSAFQLALIYAAIFLASVVVLFGALYWATYASVSRQIDATIESEILGLAEQYERRGLDGLIDVVTERVRRLPDRRAIYLLADSNLVPITGNLRRWPATSIGPNRRIEFETTLSSGQTTWYRASVLSVDRNYRLLVGRDIRELVQLNVVFERVSAWGVAMVLLLAFAGGIFMSLSAQGRIAVINRTARRIIDGDLSERVPISGIRDEYDELATNINEMLAQIEILLDNMRHVGDSVAHDLKSPLTRLRNRLETLARSDNPVSAELQKCVDETDRLLATFAALLRISRIESGAYRAAFANIDLTGIVADACDLYRVAADEKGISLNFLPEGQITIYGDRDLLAQAVVNLLDNALKFTPHGGNIDIQIVDEDDRVAIAVSDSGAGVPSMDHSRIQQRFVRLDAARTEPGNGLGLSLVKAVCDQHKGQLIMENLRPGFRVSILFPRGG